MPSIKLIIAALLLSVTITSYSHYSKNCSNQLRSIPPPGTARVSQNFFFDKEEVSNFSWQEYVYWMKQEYGATSSEYLNSLPDTAVWNEHYPELAKTYYREIQYRFHPVVGVSYEQAQAYCAWRTERVNLFYYLQFSKKDYQPDSTYENVPKIYTYRLPTEEEWKKMLAQGDDKKVAKKKKVEGNLKGSSNGKKAGKADIHVLPASVSNYLPNKFDVFNLIGNVAEMVQTENVSKGGSWIHELSASTINEQISYDSPTMWLGFRCVCDRNPDLTLN